MTRIGFATGYDYTMSVREMASAVAEAEERGYEMGFFSETWALMRDSVTALTAFGLATSKITLGCTQIVRLRSPVLMAETIATLDELTGGRIVLSPGAATQNHAHRHGFPHIDPVQTLTEWVEVFRLMLTGEKVSYKGQMLDIRDAQLGWKPIRSSVPLWFAATSATGLKLAGRLADGVLLNTVSSPEYSANAIRIVRQAVEEAGRDWSKFEVAQLINTSVEDDTETALNAVRWEVANKFMPQKVKTQSSARLRVGEPFIDPEELPRLHAAYAEGGRDGIARALSPRTVAGLTASGTPDEAKARIQRYREAGVNLPMVRPAARHQANRILELFSPK